MRKLGCCSSVLYSALHLLEHVGCCEHTGSSWQRRGLQACCRAVAQRGRLRTHQVGLRLRHVVQLHDEPKPAPREQPNTHLMA